MTGSSEVEQPGTGIASTVDQDNRMPSSKELTDIEPMEEESEEARLERLGRQRPPQFRSLWAEIGFCFAVVMSQLITEFFVSGFNVISPTVTADLNIPQEASTWPASAFSLVVSTFSLPMGRLADMYGGYPVYVGGCIWYLVWSLIAGFAKNELMLDFCRASQGLGPAAFLPASSMLFGSIYRPGPRKNSVFCIYGAMAPFGFFVGIFFAGVAGQYATWHWYFYIGTISIAITTVIAYSTIPSDIAERRAMAVKMDWWGTATISGGLILVVFAITDASHAENGWASPYIIVTSVVGVLMLAAAVYVEGWVADAPLSPFDLFAVKHMKPLIIASLLSYGSMGIFSLYATFYMEEFMGGSPMQMVAWYTPFALGGCIIATVGGFVLHIIPGTIMVVLAGITWMVTPLLYAFVPLGGNYWAWIFPAMICATVAVDTTFNITNIFITTTSPKHRQGLGGAVVNSSLQSGIAFMLGFADIVVSETAYKGRRRSSKNAFWLEFACAVVALVLMAGWVRSDTAKADLTADEKAELEARQAAEVQEHERT